MCGRLYLPMFLLRVGLLTLMYIASFMALALLWPSLLIILKFSTIVVWPVIFCHVQKLMMMLLNVLCTSLQKFWLNPQYTSSSSCPPTLEPVYNVTLFSFCFSVLWKHQQILQSVPSFNMHLDIILATDGFCSFHTDLVNKVPLCDISFLFGWCCFCLGFFCFLFFYLLVCVILYQWAHFGYLYLERTSWRCFSSLSSSLEFEHTALALCVRVLITLYLQARLWWLSHWRYKSVWVGFLYILVVRVPSSCGVTSVFNDWHGTILSGFCCGQIWWKDPQR